MNESNPLYDKALLFAERVLNMSDYLLSTRGVYSKEVCTKQVTRSGTSIAANIAEGQGAQSRADLIAKLSVAYKEGKETEMWLSLLYKKQFISEEQYTSINCDLEEVLKLLAASLNTLKNQPQ